MQPAPLNSNQWHAAIVGDLSVRQVVENIVNENNAWFPAVLASTAPRDSLLELGCGSGVFSGILAKNGRRTTLLDYSAESVEFCRKVFAQAGLVDVREFTIDVKTAIAFVHPIRARMLRRSLLLLSRLLPEAGWRFLKQGYLLVTIGQKPETIRHHRTAADGNSTFQAESA